jgi:hypothetical protein
MRPKGAKSRGRGGGEIMHSESPTGAEVVEARRRFLANCGNVFQALWNNDKCFR